MTHQDYKFSPSKGLIFLILSFVISVILIFSIAFGRDRNANKSTARTAAITLPVTKVKRSDSYATKTRYAGFVVADQQSSLSWDQNGQISDVYVDIGDIVVTGQKLATLDQKRLRADLQVLNAQMLEAQAQVKLANASLKRQEKLAKKEFSSRQILDEMHNQASTAKARLSALEAQKKSLQVQIDKSEITAPFDGIISNRFVDKGSTALPGIAAFNITASSAPTVEIALPPTKIAGFKTGEIHHFTSGTQRFRAAYKTTDAVVNGTTQTMLAIFQVSETDKNLTLPGTLIHLELNHRVDQSGFSLPISALREDQRGLWKIFKIEKTREDHSSGAQLYKLVPVPVRVNHIYPDRVYLSGNVQNDDLVVVDGLHILSPEIEILAKVLDDDR